NAPGTLKGRSGAEHLFDIVASRDGKNIVFAVTTGPTERDPRPVLSFFAKTYDVPAEREVLIAIPRLPEDARKLAETYGIEYMEVETTEEILKNMPALFSEPLHQSESISLPRATNPRDPLGGGSPPSPFSYPR
ncbi:MAG: hypothetical protein JSW01_04985, partial [Candidatus Bathyarchaeota archaeon]